VIRVRVLRESTGRNARNRGRFHQAPDAAFSDVLPSLDEFFANAKATIRPAALTMNTNDVRLKNVIRNFSCARSTTAPLVIACRRNAEQNTHLTHRMLRSLLLDESVPDRDSLAKNAAAFFKISRSSRRPVFSRRRRRFSSSSDSVGFDSAGLSFASNLLRHAWSSDGWIPSERAVCERPCPLAAITATASRLNSGLNDRRSFPMTPHGRLLRRRYVRVRETGAGSIKALT